MLLKNTIMNDFDSENNFDLENLTFTAFCTLIKNKLDGEWIDYNTGEGIYWTRVTPKEMKKYREDKTLKWEEC